MSLDTLTYIKTRSPWKVSLIFAFGIILPCGILGTIGLRSYRSEERLMRKENEERFATIADLIQMKVVKRFSDLVTAVRTVADTPGFQQLDSSQIMPVLLSPPPLADLSGASLYVFDESGRMVAPPQAGKRFSENDRTELLRRVYRQGRLDPGAVLQLPSASQSWAVAVPIRAPHSDRRRGLLLAVFPADAIESLINDTLVKSTHASGLRVEWDRSGREDRVPNDFGKPSVQGEIDVTDPALHYRLIDDGVSAHGQLFKQRQWVFAGIIGLFLIVILVGITILAHALKREIEVTNLKADFVANVSHELRTPLTVISQIGENLTLGRYLSDNEKKEIYELLSQQAGRLRGLVEDFLDFSKILAGKRAYQQEPLELVALVQESVTLFDLKAESRGFRIRPFYPRITIPIMGDGRAIIQAILNLLDNAMKYSGEARDIEVMVLKTTTEGIVAVKDQGIGISPENQQKIFEKFYRIEDKSSSHLESGVGLGLAMVKHVMEGHKGTLVVESQVRRGSIFSLTFPLAGGH